MNPVETQLPLPHSTIIRRFTEACRTDERIVACFLGGSYARGAADAFSDLDIYLITTDAAHERFIQERREFLQRLGEPLFVEDFDLPNIVFFVFADGTEGEMGIGKASDFHHIHTGPYTVLLDKKNILHGVDFSERKPSADIQTEKLRLLIFGFWHDLSHFITAMARGELWWAYGQLEALRGMCVNLTRLQYDFLDADVGDEPYFKIEKAIPIDILSPLQGTFCPMDFNAMLEAAYTILEFYQDHAPALAANHGIQYPTKLEQLMVERLESLKRQ